MYRRRRRRRRDAKGERGERRDISAVANAAGQPQVKPRVIRNQGNQHCTDLTIK